MRLMVIDRRNRQWLDIVAKALNKRGFQVDVGAEYDLSPIEINRSDIVILGCAVIGTYEENFIDFLLRQDVRVIVFTSLRDRKQEAGLYGRGVLEILDKSSNGDLIALEVEASKNRLERFRRMPFVTM